MSLPPPAATPPSHSGQGAGQGAAWSGRQFHGQPEASDLHGFLTRLWEGVRRDTAGLLAVTVEARCGGLPGSEPEALRMVQDGRLEFLALDGGILGEMAPAVAIQSLPFAFRDEGQVFAALDGALGRLLAEECERAGLLLLAEATFENGFRHFSTADRPIASAADLAGRTVRVADGEIFRDFVLALGARPLTVNIRDLHAALGSGRVGVQENTLAVMQLNRLDEVTRFLSLTGHMWSGFNLVGHLPFWHGLPHGVRAIVRRHARAAALAQRDYAGERNGRMVAELAARGMVVNTADVGSFREALARGGFHARWRRRLGEEAWAALEAAVGPPERCRA